MLRRNRLGLAWWPPLEEVLRVGYSFDAPHTPAGIVTADNVTMRLSGMHEPVMTPAQHHQIVDIGRAAGRPVLHMVCVGEIVRAVTTGEHAPVVANPQITVLTRGHRTSGATHRQRHPHLRRHHRRRGTVTRQPAGGFRTQRRVEVARHLRPHAQSFTRVRLQRGQIHHQRHMRLLPTRAGKLRGRQQTGAQLSQSVGPTLIRGPLIPPATRFALIARGVSGARSTRENKAPVSGSDMPVTCTTPSSVRDTCRQRCSNTVRSASSAQLRHHAQ